MRVGLEKEFFVLRDEKPIPLVRGGGLCGYSFGIPFGIPHDECGWLAEARSQPFTSIIDAVFSLKAAVYRIERQIADINKRPEFTAVSPLVLTDNPVMKMDRSVKLQAARYFPKGVIKYQNLYGHQCHKNSMREATAGVHVSFTDERSYRDKEGTERTYNINFDWPQIFIKLDAAFAEEIKASKRRPGFYEIKPDGRVEYRSLPANVDLDKLINVL